MDDTASATPTPADSPRGRRPRPSRPHVIKFRVSQEEYDQLRNKAKGAKTTLTALLRDHIHQTRIAPQDGMQHLAAVHRLRVNMEALLEWCRTYKGLAETAIITAHLVALEREVARLTEGLRDHA
jgi:hypothetical protein